MRGNRERATICFILTDIDVIVDRVFNKELLSAIASITNQKNRSVAGNLPSSSIFETTTSVPILSSISTDSTSPSPAPSPSAQPSSMPSPIEQCGVPPNFIPCLPLEQANARLQSCCQSKLLPPGCLPLCRYDTTQAEIKMAFDKGQCGILNVAPVCFLLLG